MKKTPFPGTLLLLLLALAVDASSQFTTPANEYTFSTEKQLQDPEYRQKLYNFYQRGEAGTFEGKAGIPIYYKYFKQGEGKESGAIVISTGRTEGAVKYQELIYDLFQNGYSVYIHDHRGQGLSGRMADDHEMGHVDNFQYYVDDMKTFVDSYVKPGNHQNIYLLAHSMGGTIGMSYLEQYPDDFTAAAFSSPMLALSAYICPLAKILSGKTPKYAPGQTGYNNDSTAFDGNDVSGSEIRYHMKIAAYAAEPDAKVGGPSVQWLEESCKQMKEVMKNTDKLQIPVLIFTAENETVVNPKGFEKFAKKAEKNGTNVQLFPIANAQHEILMEKDAPRAEALQKTLQFYRNAAR